MDNLNVQKGGPVLAPGLPNRPPATKDDKPLVLHFDAWLVAGGAALSGLVAELFSIIPQPSITEGRSHRADAVRRRYVCLESLLANLAACALSPLPYSGIATSVTNAKASRYDRAGFNVVMLRTYIAHMEEMGAVTVIPALFKQQRTILMPTPLFADMLKCKGVTALDIGRVGGREIIELWATRTVRKVGSEGKESDKQTRSKDLVDYADTPETVQLRNDMEAVNVMLNNADLRLAGKPMPPVHLVRKFRTDGHNACHSFHRHGRLYGGWWQVLPKGQRHLLTIRGEPVADLDYASMFIRLAYLRQGVMPPEGDLYAVPGLEGHRDAVKELMVSLFFRRRVATKFPRGTAERMPSGWNMQRFKDAVQDRHRAIASMFDTEVGFELMADESRLLVAIMLKLAGSDIPSLAMHDGVMVPRSARHKAMGVMAELSRLHLGYALRVVEKKVDLPWV